MKIRSRVVPFFPVLVLAAGCGGRDSVDLVSNPNHVIPSAQIRMFTDLAFPGAGNITINGVAYGQQLGVYVTVPAGNLDISMQVPAPVPYVANFKGTATAGHTYTGIGMGNIWVLDETKDLPSTAPKGKVLFKYLNDSNEPQDLFYFPAGNISTFVKIGSAPAYGESPYLAIPIGTQLVGAGIIDKGQFEGTVGSANFSTGSFTGIPGQMYNGFPIMTVWGP